MTTPTTVNGLRLRKVFGREDWLPPVRFGPDGWKMVSRHDTASVIVTAFDLDGGVEWIHASISRPDRMPDYDDLKLLHRAAFGDGWAYQVFAPAADHINIHAHALHLFGRVDGKRVLPDFGRFGTI